MARLGSISLLTIGALAVAGPGFAQYPLAQPGYNQAPGYGQVPNSGQPSQGYGQPSPGFNQGPPTYGGQAPPNYGPSQGYGQTPPGYGQTGPGYGPTGPGNGPQGYFPQRGGFPGFRCNASFPFRGMQQTLVCNMNQPRPVGSPCSCPPPAGFPVGGQMPGQVIQ